MENFESIKKFGISRKEINRREIAYASLLIFLIVGIFICEILFKLQVLFPGTVIIGILLFISWLYFHIFFKSIIDNKVCIFDKCLYRFENDAWTKYSLEDIKRINIKHTTRNTIREVAVFPKEGQSIFINGLEDFDKFTKELCASVGKEVEIREITEPLDFDHLLFYPILGTLLSFTGVGFLRLMINFDSQTMKLLLGIFSVYLISLGIYFLYSRPISKSYGKNRSSTDRVWAIMLISAGLFMVFLTLVL
jgi:hypothetical protein